MLMGLVKDYKTKRHQWSNLSSKCLKSEIAELLERFFKLLSHYLKFNNLIGCLVSRDNCWPIKNIEFENRGDRFRETATTHLIVKLGSSLVWFWSNSPDSRSRTSRWNSWRSPAPNPAEQVTDRPMVVWLWTSQSRGSSGGPGMVKHLFLVLAGF